MITEEQRLIILKALRDSYANLTAVNMTEKKLDNLIDAMTIVKNCSTPDDVGQREQLNIKRWCLQCKCREAQRDGLCKRCYDEIYT